MDQTVFKAYLQLLRELTKVIDQLGMLARRKLEEVRANNVQGVDDCIRQEQVLSLSLRGLEQRREKALKAMGLEGLRLHGLVTHAPDALRQETVEVSNALFDSYETYCRASSAARSGLERVLHQIDRMMAEQPELSRPAGGVRPNPRQSAEEAPPIGGHGADFKA